MESPAAFNEAGYRKATLGRSICLLQTLHTYTGSKGLPHGRCRIASGGPPRSAKARLDQLISLLKIPKKSLPLAVRWYSMRRFPSATGRWISSRASTNVFSR
jgi:hypothetical protein